MTDRELLERAAKAAGYVPFASYPGRPGVELCGKTNKSKLVWWSPLTDDGDALRLAVMLRMELGFEGDNVVFADGNFSEFLSEDPAAATRRAIVRAAAEIGKVGNSRDSDT